MRSCMLAFSSSEKPRKLRTQSWNGGTLNSVRNSSCPAWKFLRAGNKHIYQNVCPYSIISIHVFEFNGFKNQENDFYIPVEKLDSRWDITAKLSYITVYIFLHYKKKYPYLPWIHWSFLWKKYEKGINARKACIQFKMLLESNSIINNYFSGALRKFNRKKVPVQKYILYSFVNITVNNCHPWDLLGLEIAWSDTRIVSSRYCPDYFRIEHWKK